MNKFYEENYNAGKIKGTYNYQEEYVKPKKNIIKMMNENNEITLGQIYNFFNDPNINEKRKRKETIDKLKEYYKKNYPNL